MSCTSCGVKSNTCTDCTTCNPYCTPCRPAYNELIVNFSDKYHKLENNYPMHKCLCHDFGIKPKYYSPAHIPCNCKDKCYPC